MSSDFHCKSHSSVMQILKRNSTAAFVKKAACLCRVNHAIIKAWLMIICKKTQPSKEKVPYFPWLVFLLNFCATPFLVRFWESFSCNLRCCIVVAMQGCCASLGTWWSNLVKNQISPAAASIKRVFSVKRSATVIYEDNQLRMCQRDEVSMSNVYSGPAIPSVGGKTTTLRAAISPTTASSKPNTAATHNFRAFPRCVEGEERFGDMFKDNRVSFTTFQKLECIEKKDCFWLQFDFEITLPLWMLYFPLGFKTRSSKRDSLAAEVRMDLV